MARMRFYLVVSGLLCVLAFVFVLIFTPSDYKTAILMACLAVFEFLAAKYLIKPKKRRRSEWKSDLRYSQTRNL